MIEETDILNIEDLVREDNLAGASEMLWERVCLCGDVDTRDDTILLQRRVNEIERESRRGTLSFDEISRHRAQLANNLLATLRALMKSH